MVMVKNYGDPNLYRNYYKAQAGYGLPGYHGVPVMYGAGVGGIFRSLFRKAVPLLRRGLEIIKPHAKNAVQNIAKDVIGHVSRAVLEKVVKPAKQEGSGLMYIQRKILKRKRDVPDSGRAGPPQPLKKKRVSRRGSQTQKTKKQPGRKKGRSPGGNRNIF